jgi:hypothetical protein
MLEAAGANHEERDDQEHQPAGCPSPGFDTPVLRPLAVREMLGTAAR